MKKKKREIENFDDTIEGFFDLFTAGIWAIVILGLTVSVVVITGLVVLVIKLIELLQ